MALSKALHSDNFSCTVSEYGFEGRGVVSSGADGITGHGLPLGSVDEFETRKVSVYNAKTLGRRESTEGFYPPLKKGFSDV